MRIIVFVLLALLGVGLIIGQQISGKGEAETTTDTQPRYLLFADTVNEGDFVDLEDLKWAVVDPAMVTLPSYAILKTDQDIESFNGALVMKGARANDFVDPGTILLPGQNRFLASVLKPGMRAISIQIDAVTGNSGLIQPGNRVDLILFTSLGDIGGRQDVFSEKAGFMAKTILENMRIIAINRRIDNRADTGNPEGNDQSGKVKAGTATLEVSPQQAEVITLARKIGTLTLSLRSDFEQAGDSESTTGGSGIRSHDVIGYIPALEKSVPVLEMYGLLARQRATDSTGQSSRKPDEEGSLSGEGVAP